MTGAVGEKASEMTEAVSEKASEMMETSETAAMEELPSTYIVKKGDSLFEIGQKYNMSWEKLAEENNIENPDYLHVGQEIRIPEN